MSYHFLGDCIMSQNIDAFVQEGYQVFKNFFSEAQIEEAKQDLNQFLETQQAQAYVYYEEIEGKKDIRRIEKVGQNIKGIGDLFQDENLQEILKQIFDEPALLFKDKVNFKPPQGKGFAPHLDGHFIWKNEKGEEKYGWGEYADRFVSCVIPLDPQTVENGCLKLAPLKYYHQLGSNIHEITRLMDYGTPNLPKKLMDEIELHPVETNVGDIILFDWRCVHGSDQNKTDNYRRIAYSTYSGESHGDVYNKYFTDKENSTLSDVNKSLMS